MIILSTVVALILTLFAQVVSAQSVWVDNGDCASAGECALTGNLVITSLTPTTCTVSGIPGAPITTAVVAKSSLPSPLNVDSTLTDLVCYWTNVIFTAGSTYTITAISNDSGGSSSASTALNATVLTPCGQ